MRARGAHGGAPPLPYSPEGGRRLAYGPVRSRRLGISLGIEVVPFATCTFDCIYCERGRTRCRVRSASDVREPFPAAEEVLGAARRLLDMSPRLDHVTVSGSGEPLLSPHLGAIARGLRDVFASPLALITNGSLLADPSARASAERFDLVVPSLDAATDEGLARVDRPAPGFRARDIVEAIAGLARSSATVRLEVMLVRSDLGPTNVDPSSIDALVEAARRIGPSSVDLTTCVRPPAEVHVRPLGGEELEAVAERFAAAGLAARAVPASIPGAGPDDAVEQRIEALVGERPRSGDELARALGLDGTEVERHLLRLLWRGRVERDGAGASAIVRPAGGARGRGMGGRGRASRGANE